MAQEKESSRFDIQDYLFRLEDVAGINSNPLLEVHYYSPPFFAETLTLTTISRKPNDAYQQLRVQEPQIATAIPSKDQSAIITVPHKEPFYLRFSSPETLIESSSKLSAQVITSDVLDNHTIVIVLSPDLKPDQQQAYFDFFNPDATIQPKSYPLIYILTSQKAIKACANIIDEHRVTQSTLNQVILRQQPTPTISVVQ